MKHIFKILFVFTLCMAGYNTAMAQSKKPVQRTATKVVKKTVQKKAGTATAGKTVDKMLDSYEALLENMRELKKDGIPGSSSAAMRISEKDEEICSKLEKMKKQMTPEQKKRYEDLLEKVGKEAATWE